MVVWIVFLGADIYTWYIFKLFFTRMAVRAVCYGLYYLESENATVDWALRLKSAFSWGSNPARFNFAFHLS